MSTLEQLRIKMGMRKPVNARSILVFFLFIFIIFSLYVDYNRMAGFLSFSHYEEGALGDDEFHIIYNKNSRLLQQLGITHNFYTTLWSPATPLTNISCTCLFLQLLNRVLQKTIQDVQRRDNHIFWKDQNSDSDIGRPPKFLAETPFSGFWYDDAEEAGWFSKGGIYNFIYLHIGHLSTHFSFLLSMIRGITVGTWAILYYVKMYQKVDFLTLFRWRDRSISLPRFGIEATPESETYSGICNSCDTGLMQAAEVTIVVPLSIYTVTLQSQTRLHTDLNRGLGLKNKISHCVQQHNTKNAYAQSKTQLKQNGRKAKKQLKQNKTTARKQCGMEGQHTEGNFPTLTAVSFSNAYISGTCQVGTPRVLFFPPRRRYHTKPSTLFYIFKKTMMYFIIIFVIFFGGSNTVAAMSDSCTLLTTASEDLNPSTSDYHDLTNPTTVELGRTKLLADIGKLKPSPLSTSHSNTPHTIPKNKTHLFTIATFNMRRSFALNIHLILNWATKEGIDAICLQETGIDEKEGRRILHSLQSTFIGFFSFLPTEPVSGSAVLLTKQLAHHVIAREDIEGRFTSVILGFRKRELRITSVYWPADRQYHAFPALQQHFNKTLKRDAQQNREGFWGGDWNEALAPQDREGKWTQHAKIKSGLQTLVTHDMIDLYRLQNPHTLEYTFERQTITGTMKSRIDSIWTSEQTATLLKSASITNPFDSSISDHFPTVVSFHCTSLFTLATPPPTQKRTILLPKSATPEQQLHFAKCIQDQLEIVHQRFTMETMEFHPERRSDTIHRMEQLTQTLHTAMINIGLKTLPKRKVGGPRPLVSPLHPIYSLRAFVLFILKSLQNPTSDTSVLLTTHLNNFVTELQINLEDPLIQYLAESLQPTTPLDILTATFKRIRNRINQLHKNLINHSKADKIRTAIETRHQIFATGSMKKILRNVLNRQQNSVVIDRLRIQQDGMEILTYNGEEVKAGVATAVKEWFEERELRPLNADSSLHAILAPREDIDPKWYDGLMDPPNLEEVQDHLMSMGISKAPGPSGITRELYLLGGEYVLGIMTHLLELVFLYGDIPPSWGATTIVPIPKKADWGGTITNTRPISLLEVIYKLQQRVVTSRLQKVFQQHSHILCGLNSAALPGTSTSLPIGVIQHSMDLALEDKKPLYIVLNDIQKAFDSAPKEGQVRSWRRLRIPETYINMRLRSQSQAKARVVTAHGLTDLIPLGAIIQQGAVTAPLDWSILWDPVLYAIHTLTKGVTFEAKTNIKTTNPLQITTQTAKVAAAAHADDTTLLSRSREDMLAQIALMVEYQDSCNIRSNTSKVVILGMNIRDDEPSVPWGMHGTINIRTNKIEERILGVYRDAQGTHEPTKRHILQKVDEMSRALATKAISDKMAVYCVNRVLIPQLEYLWQYTVLNDSFLKTVDQRIRAMVKPKLGLAQSAPNTLLYHPHIHGLMNARSAHHISQINSLMVQLNDGGILGEITRVRLLQLQHHMMTTHQPLSNPTLSPKGRGFLSRIQPLLREFGLHVETLLHNPESPTVMWGQVVGGNTPIQQVLEWEAARVLLPKLRKGNLWFIEQLTTIDNSKFLSKTETRRMHSDAPTADCIVALCNFFRQHNIQKPMLQWPTLLTPNPHYNLNQPTLAVTRTKWATDMFVMAVSQDVESEPVMFRIQQLKPNRASGQWANCQHYRPLTTEDVAGAEEWLDLLHEGVRLYIDCEGCRLDQAGNYGSCRQKQNLDLLYCAKMEFAADHHETSLTTLQRGTAVITRRIYGLAMDDSEIESLRNPTLLEERVMDEITLPNVTLFARENHWWRIEGEQRAVLKIMDAFDFKTEVDSELEVYTDGSLVNGSEMGSGIYANDGKDILAMSVRVPNLPASSYTAELVALLLAHSMSQNHLTIHLDNQAVVTTYNRLFNATNPITSKQYLHTPNGYLWSVLAEIRSRHRRPPNVRWIKGHDGNEGNERADQLANVIDSPMVTVKFSAQTTLPFMLKFRELGLMGQLRHQLKMINRIRMHTEWTQQPSFNFICPVDQWDLEVTFLNLHGGLKPTMLFSTMSESHFRKFRIQLMHHLLPTQKEMHRRQPHLYNDDLCRRCHSDVEDAAHLLTCPQNNLVMTDILHTFAADLAALVADTDPACQLAVDTTWCSSESLQPPQNLALLTGWVPITITNALKSAGVPASKRRKGLLAAMRSLTNNVHKLIWLPRCNSTIAWEEEHGITQKQKLTKQQRPRLARRRPTDRRKTATKACNTCCGRHGPSCPPHLELGQLSTDIWMQHYMGHKQLQAGAVSMIYTGIETHDTVQGEYQQALMKERHGETEAVEQN
jgi:exonuclease III/ribonuclease HI